MCMETTANTEPTKMYATFNLDPNKGWTITRESTGKFGQHRVTGPHTWAVETTYNFSEGPKTNRMHGAWDKRAAERFAWSMCDGDRSKAVEVEPYYYCESWGRVPAASVHALDEVAMYDWSKRPAAAIVLGSDPL